MELEQSILRHQTMRGHLLITHPVSNVYQASVVADVVGRGWSKQYSSKPECLSELRLLGLISMDDQDEVTQSDLNLQDQIEFDTSVIPIALVGADFVEMKPAKLN